MRTKNYHHGLIADVQILDVFGDEHAEAVVARWDNEGTWVEILKLPDLDTRLISQILPTPDSDQSGTWSGSIQIGGCLDVDQDGSRDIVILVGGGYDRRPRGLYIFSGASGQMIRSFETAGPPSKVHICETEDRSQAWMILSTAAPGNDVFVETFADSCYYVYSLNRKAELLWWRKTAESPEGGGLTCTDLDGDDHPEVIFDQQIWNRPPAERHRLEVRDAQTGDLIVFRGITARTHVLMAEDLDRDGSPELLAAFRDGTLQVLDTNLDVDTTRTFDPWLWPRWIGDADLDGTTEIAMQSGRCRLSMLNRSLDPMAEFEFNGAIGHVSRALINPPRSFLLALVTEPSGTSRVHILNLRSHRAHAYIPSPAGVRGGVVASLILLVAIVLGALIALTLERYKRKRATGREREADRVYEVLLSHLAAFGHNEMARSNLERLAQYLEAPPEKEDSRYKEYQVRLATIVHTYREFTRGPLEQIAELVVGWDQWGIDGRRLRQAVAQLSRGLPARKPDQWILQASPQTLKAAAQHARDVLRQVRELRRRVLAALYTDVATTTCRVLMAALESLRERGVDDLSLAVTRFGSAHVDERCLKTCLEIVLGNAVDAMRGNPVRKLHVQIDGWANGLAVRIADSGCGIPIDQWERIFDRGITTKGEGRGLGLYHARQALGRYDASLRVESSSSERGTVFIMKLPGADSPSMSPRGGSAREDARV